MRSYAYNSNGTSVGSSVSLSECNSYFMSTHLKRSSTRTIKIKGKYITEADIVPFLRFLSRVTKIPIELKGGSISFTCNGQNSYLMNKFIYMNLRGLFSSKDNGARWIEAFNEIGPIYGYVTAYFLARWLSNKTLYRNVTPSYNMYLKLKQKKIRLKTFRDYLSGSQSKDLMTTLRHFFNTKQSSGERRNTHPVNRVTSEKGVKAMMKHLRRK